MTFFLFFFLLQISSGKWVHIFFSVFSLKYFFYQNFMTLKYKTSVIVLGVYSWRSQWGTQTYNYCDTNELGGNQLACGKTKDWYQVSVFLMRWNIWDKFF